MSYDIWLEADLGGHKPYVIDENHNHTSNTSRMWSAAGADLAEMDGLSAGECIPLLERAVADMNARPEFYATMNPPNGWGSNETYRAFLSSLLDFFRKAPRAKVVVSR